MTPQQPKPPANPSSTMNLRGAVDLSSLKNPAPAPAAPSGPTAGSEAGAGNKRVVMDVNEQGFSQLIQLSAEIPVVVELHAAYSSISTALSPVLEKLVASYAGRLVLARVDVEAYPQIAEAFQAQSVPTVVAVLKGQPVPLFQGSVPEEQIRQFLDELLKVAAENGVTGSLDESAAATEGTNDDDAATEPPLPPLHQEAFDAIEAGNYAAAAEAYRKALAEQPADDSAKAGLAQVELLQRLQNVDATVVRSAGADAPEDVQAQLAVADLDVSGGHVEDGFNRVIAFIARTFGADRETARVRLLEYFDIIGSTDSRVAKARMALARVLF